MTNIKSLLEKKMHFKTPKNEGLISLSLSIASHPMSNSDIDESTFALLTNEEFIELGKAKTIKRKNEFAYGRLVAKQALFLSIGTSQEYTSIIRGPNGEPIVKNFDADSLKVSISHSGSLAAAIAFPTDCAFSIDLETTKSKDVPHLMKDQFIFEKNVLENLDLSEDQKLHLCWSAKESLSKIIIQHSKLAMGDYKLKSIVQTGLSTFETTFDKFDQFKTMTFFETDYTYSICMLKGTTVS